MACNICEKILAVFFTPLEQTRYNELGTKEEVMSTVCHDHKPFILEWHWGEGQEQGPIIVYKRTGESCLGGFGPAYELVAPDPVHNKHSINHTTTEQLSVRGRGKILDRDWIDFQTVKDWYRLCQQDHGLTCSTPPFLQHLTSRPRYLIDTHSHCVVAAGAEDPYVALSYVWGDVQSLQLMRANIETLQSPSALRMTHLMDSIPLTILNAMDFVRLLGERYLWVDSLCIIQDEDDGLKQEQLNGMTAIYANSVLTIVAADGPDAGYGLRGLENASPSRKRFSNQKIIPFGPHGTIVKRIFRTMNQRRATDPEAVYYERAWTYQESMFSKRRIFFEKGSVVWECSSTTWFEDVDCSDGTLLKRRPSLVERQKALAETSAPQLCTFINLVAEYNRLQLTYEKDRHGAFGGIITALARSIEGGFLCGLPELCFDTSLLWEPMGMVGRRRADSYSGRSHLPSWSWSGWEGLIDIDRWKGCLPFLVKGAIFHSGTLSRETLPITLWYVGTSKDGRKIIDQTNVYRDRYRDTSQSLPKGWERMGFDHGSCGVFYTLDSCSDWKFQFPLPNSGFNKPGTSDLSSRLSATVQTTTLRLRDTAPPDAPANKLFVNLEDNHGQWAGILRLHDYSGISQHDPVELIAISFGRARNSEGLERSLIEWKIDERPKEGVWYEFYNVLSIVWIDGIAERRGIGRVSKEMWERQDPKEIDVVLG